MLSICAANSARNSLGDGRVDEQPLHRDAGLPGAQEAAEGAALGGVGHVGVRVDDDRAVAAELQRDAVRVGDAAQVPADLAAAGERQRAHALVAGHRARRARWGRARR